MITRLIATLRDGGTSVKVHRTDDGEYRVRLYNGGVPYAPADYYTTDLEDAMGTARAMLAHTTE